MLSIISSKNIIITWSNNLVYETIINFVLAINVIDNYIRQN